jgi:predicted RNA methylase
VRHLKTRTVEEFGDFQTPPELAQAVATGVRAWGVNPGVVVEPTCGVGNLLVAAAEEFSAAKILGYEINPGYAAVARQRMAQLDAGKRVVAIATADFFN